MAVWKKINSKIIHQNPWYSLREDDVIRPDGKPGKYYYVDDADAVAIVAEDSDGEIYLCRQTRYTADNQLSWEVFGGQIENLDPLVAAKKELNEEAGMIANSWGKIGSFYEASGWAHVRVTVFLARELKMGEKSLEPTEDIIINKFKWAEIENMIKDNTLFDSFSITPLYKYKIFLNKKS